MDTISRDTSGRHQKLQAMCVLAVVPLFVEASSIDVGGVDVAPTRGLHALAPVPAFPAVLPRSLAAEQTDDDAGPTSDLAHGAAAAPPRQLLASASWPLQDAPAGHRGSPDVPLSLAPKLGPPL